jgi:hypothetical protein
MKIDPPWKGTMRQEAALLVIVRWLRAGRRNIQMGPSHYGYDLYLPTLIRWYLGAQSPGFDLPVEIQRNLSICLHWIG